MVRFEDLDPGDQVRHETLVQQSGNVALANDRFGVDNEPPAAPAPAAATDVRPAQPESKPNREISSAERSAIAIAAIGGQPGDEPPQYHEDGTPDWHPQRSWGTLESEERAQQWRAQIDAEVRPTRPTGPQAAEITAPADEPPHDRDAMIQRARDSWASIDAASHQQ